MGPHGTAHHTAWYTRRNISPSRRSMEQGERGATGCTRVVAVSPIATLVTCFRLKVCLFLLPKEGVSPDEAVCRNTYNIDRWRMNALQTAYIATKI